MVRYLAGGLGEALASLDGGSDRRLGQVGMTQSFVVPGTEPRLNLTLTRELEGPEVIKHSAQYLTHTSCQ